MTIKEKVFERFKEKFDGLYPTIECEVMFNLTLEEVQKKLEKVRNELKIKPSFIEKFDTKFLDDDELGFNDGVDKTIEKLKEELK